MNPKSNKHPTAQMQLNQQHMISVYQRSSIFLSPQSRGIFSSSVTFGSNCPNIQIPDTQDSLHRIVYYYLLFFAFESGQPHSGFLIDSFSRVLQGYGGEFYCPASLNHSKIRLTCSQIREYYLRFVGYLKEEIEKDKLVRLLNRSIVTDYVFMAIISTLSREFGGLNRFLTAIGINIQNFGERQIQLDNFIIKFHRRSGVIEFRIEKEKLYQQLINNKQIDMCESIGTLSLSKESQNNSFECIHPHTFGFLGTAREANSFYHSRMEDSKEELKLFEPGNDISRDQLCEVLGSLQEIPETKIQHTLFNPELLFLMQGRSKSENKQTTSKEGFRIQVWQPEKTPSLISKESDPANPSFFEDQGDSKNHKFSHKKRRYLSEHPIESAKSEKRLFTMVKSVNQIYIPSSSHVVSKPKQEKSKKEQHTTSLLSTMNKIVWKPRNSSRQINFEIGTPREDRERTQIIDGKIKIIRGFFKKDRSARKSSVKSIGSLEKRG